MRAVRAVKPRLMATISARASRMRFAGVQTTFDVDYESSPSADAWSRGPSVQTSTSVGGRRAKAAVVAKSRDAGLGPSEEPDKEPRSREKVTPSPLHHGGKPWEKLSFSLLPSLHKLSYRVCNLSQWILILI